MSTKEEIALLEQQWSPCLYKPKYAYELYEHLRKGFSFASFTVDAKVCHSTLEKWKKRFPAFQAAKESGERAKLKRLESEGMKMVKGGNVVAWKFLMNQMGVTEKSEVQHSHQGNISVTPNINAPIRQARIEKLKELNKRVQLEEKVIDVDVDEVTDKDLEGL